MVEQQYPHMSQQIIDPRIQSAANMFGNATSGRDTLANIEQTIEDLRAKERALQVELEVINTTRSNCIEQRLTAYRELAEVRARHAISDGVIDEADRLATRVASLLIARQKTMADLKQRLAKSDDTRATLIRARQALADRIEQLEVALDRLALEAREALTNNPDYRQELGAAEKAAATHTKAAEKAGRSATDRLNKGRAYETDPLFMYLWRRGHSTSAYKTSGVVRWLDGIIAHHIGYHDARANYAVLNDIPVRLKAHVDALSIDLRTKRTAIESRETKKIREIAGADMPGQLREARTAETQNQQAVEQAAAELSDLSEQLNKYAEGQDAAFAKAVEMSAEFLGQERTTRLMQLARETQSPTDDEIALRIARLDTDIAKAVGDIENKTQDLEKLFDKRDELVRIAANFRRAHYDDPASIFRGGDVGTILLQELLRGVITGADYWARTRRSQSWRQRPADPYRRSENFPPFDDLFGGSGSGGWGSDSGDSWSHGDDDFGTDGGF